MIEKLTFTEQHAALQVGKNPNAVAAYMIVKHV